MPLAIVLLASLGCVPVVLPPGRVEASEGLRLGIVRPPATQSERPAATGSMIETRVAAGIHLASALQVTPVDAASVRCSPTWASGIESSTSYTARSGHLFAVRRICDCSSAYGEKHSMEMVAADMRSMEGWRVKRMGSPRGILGITGLAGASSAGQRALDGSSSLRRRSFLVENARPYSPGAFGFGSLPLLLWCAVCPRRC